MANRTSKDAKTVKGTNPQYLVEKIIRMRIYDSRFWKEECFALSAALIVDKALELKFIGGIYGGNIKPTPFMCLTLKMLQIQPDKDIVIEFILQKDSKYLRALGAYYMRLTGSSLEIYKYLEPLYNDYRKLRWMSKEGKFELMHMDDFVDNLLREEHVCDIQLPRLQKREFLEDTQQLEPRVSGLEEDLDNLSASSDDEVSDKKSVARSADKEKSRRSPEHRRRSKSPRRRRSVSRERDRRRRSRSKSRDRERSKSRERERRPKSPKSSRNKDTKSGGDRSRKDREDSLEREIREQNELRAKLGLQPLR